MSDDIEIDRKELLEIIISGIPTVQDKTQEIWDHMFEHAQKKVKGRINTDCLGTIMAHALIVVIYDYVINTEKLLTLNNPNLTSKNTQTQITIFGYIVQQVMKRLGNPPEFGVNLQ